MQFLKESIFNKLVFLFEYFSFRLRSLVRSMSLSKFGSDSDASLPNSPRRFRAVLQSDSDDPSPRREAVHDAAEPRRRLRKARADGTPLAKALAAAERFAARHRADDSDIESLFRSSSEPAQGASTSAPSTDESDSDGPHRAAELADDRRRWYLVTWSHPKRQNEPFHKWPGSMTREEFAAKLCATAEACLGTPYERYVVVDELHKNGRVHKQAAVLHEKRHRLPQIANALRECEIYVNLKIFNSYAGAARYLTEESSHKGEAELDQTPCFSPHHPPLHGVRRTTDVPRPAEAEEEGRRRTKKRLTDGDLYDLIVEQNIKDVDDLRAYAHIERRLVQFLMHNQRRVPAMISEAWAIAQAREVRRLRRLSRIDLLWEALNRGCRPGCYWRWYDCAKAVLQLQECDGRFQAAVRHCFTVGRRKGSNLYVWGDRDCGKSFLLAPLKDVFPPSTILMNVAAGSK